MPAPPPQSTYGGGSLARRASWSASMIRTLLPSSGSSRGAQDASALLTVSRDDPGQSGDLAPASGRERPAACRVPARRIVAQSQQLLGHRPGTSVNMWSVKSLLVCRSRRAVSANSCPAMSGRPAIQAFNVSRSIDTARTSVTAWHWRYMALGRRSTTHRTCPPGPGCSASSPDHLASSALS
jgi:hypothetical protein